jgi:hypothetical protein
MTSANDTATPPRITVRIPTVSGEEIEAWVYRPPRRGTASSRRDGARIRRRESGRTAAIC